MEGKKKELISASRLNLCYIELTEPSVKQAYGGKKKGADISVQTKPMLYRAN
jgi:hypothetical protein